MRWLALALIPLPAMAEAVVTLRHVPAGTVLSEADLTVVAADIPGALEGIGDALGQQLRHAVPAGRALRLADIAAPARVERNQIVALRYQAGGLTILTEGRALDRGAEGETVAVMNPASRNTVTGLVLADGSIRVTGGVSP
jgi:flagella basal body P-ring formation protein FlgA